MKTLVKQGLLVLLLLVVFSYAMENPDMVEEKGVFGTSVLSSTAEKRSENGESNEMSGGTSSMDDDDSEMVSESFHDDDDDYEMDNNFDNGDGSSVKKSKIERNTSQSIKETDNEEDDEGTTEFKGTSEGENGKQKDEMVLDGKEKHQGEFNEEEKEDVKENVKENGLLNKKEDSYEDKRNSIKKQNGDSNKNISRDKESNGKESNKHEDVQERDVLGIKSKKKQETEVRQEAEKNEKKDGHQSMDNTKVEKKESNKHEVVQERDVLGIKSKIKQETEVTQEAEQDERTDGDQSMDNEKGDKKEINGPEVVELNPELDKKEMDDGSTDDDLSFFQTTELKLPKENSNAAEAKSNDTDNKENEVPKQPAKKSDKGLKKEITDAVTEDRRLEINEAKTGAKKEGLATNNNDNEKLTTTRNGKATENQAGKQYSTKKSENNIHTENSELKPNLGSKNHDKPEETVVSDDKTLKSLGNPSNSTEQSSQMTNNNIGNKTTDKPHVETKENEMNEDLQTQNQAIKSDNDEIDENKTPSENDGNIPNKYEKKTLKEAKDNAAHFENKNGVSNSGVKENDLNDDKQTTLKPDDSVANKNKDNYLPDMVEISDSFNKARKINKEKENSSQPKSKSSNESGVRVSFGPSDTEQGEANESGNDYDQRRYKDSSKHDEGVLGKVEQLSMNTGDESEEEGELAISKDKNSPQNAVIYGQHGINEEKFESSGDNDEDIPNSDRDSGEPQGSNENSSYQEKHNKLAQSEASTVKTTTPSSNGNDMFKSLASSVASNEEASDAEDTEISGDQTGEDYAQKTSKHPNEDITPEDKKESVKNLLNDLVPSGILPNLPESFGSLAEMSTATFTYNVHQNNEITVTSDMKEPMQLFHGKLDISKGRLVFSYNDRETKGQKWQFRAQGTWINGEQRIEVILESSKHDDHFTLTGKGNSLALHDYSSIFANQETFKKSGIKMDIFEEIMLSNIELYVVFKDFENIVSLVSGKVGPHHKIRPSRCQTFIEKFPEKDPVFSILLDFDNSSPHTVLSSVMADDVPYVKKLLGNRSLLKVANGSFGFAASSGDVKRIRLDVFGEGMLERELGSHISSGLTLTLPISFHSQKNIENHDVIIKIAKGHISFYPTKHSNIDLTKVFKTLSQFTRPKIASLGYPDVSKMLLRELHYDLEKSVYSILGQSANQFNIAPGMLNLDDANLEFRQQVPDEFATLALYGTGSSNIGQARLNVSIQTNMAAGEILISGSADTLWSADVSRSFGVTMEIDNDVKGIMDENRMLHMNIENPRMFTTVKDGRTGLVHFSGFSRPISWNDAIQVELVVFHDYEANKKRMAIGYLFNKLPLTYAIDALSFGRFPSPRLLENSRNTSLVLSPVNSESLFLNPGFNGLSFMRGLSLVGQLRLPDVCSLNNICEAATQLLGTEKWYRVQGLVSSRGYTLAGYVDKDFNLAKGLRLSDNVLQFTLGNYSYMSISTTLRLDNDNLTFNGYVDFDPNSVRLRMSSKDNWAHPFPGKFLTFDRLQIDVPLVSGITMDELLVQGEMNFGLNGSLYRLFAPVYLSFIPSKPKNIGFQATLTNVTLETMTSALNFKSSLPEVLINSRFPGSLVARYKPNERRDSNIELYGKLEILSRTLICKLRIDRKKRITATTSHSKYPLMLDDGLITVYADKHRTRLGPRLSFTVTPENTKLKLDGFANFMGLRTTTEIDVTESGTQFTLEGNLFGVTKTVVSFMSPESLPDSGPYFASACLPDIIPHLTSHVHLLLASAADQAERYMKQASKNLEQATMYHEQALADEYKHITMLDKRENDIENDDREMFYAEERYNKTCREQECGKTCIGCTSWLKCCDHDVFGNCVKCPGWKSCCWHGKNPLCKGKNHACRIMKKVAAENLQKIARRVNDGKEKKRAREKILWKSEFTTGKTQAVLDAARRALHLVNHDSKIELAAADTIKRFGLEHLVNIHSVCFHTTLKNLATRCIDMKVNTTFASDGDSKTLTYYGCLNKELVPSLASHVAHSMFKDKQNDDASSKAKEKLKRGRGRSGHGLFGEPSEEDQVDLSNLKLGNTYTRRRREQDWSEDDTESKPFWLIRNNYQPRVLSLLQQRTTVPKSPLRKKWQIPASRKGKCKVHRQLVEICKDMMGTVKRMFESYEDGKIKYRKRLTELQLGVNTTINDLEKEVMVIPELRDRLPDIEMNIRTVGAGVSQWKMNCESDQEDQNKIAIQDWVSTMEGRIRKLGGQGVDRFLSNLFRAFEGMFLGAETPKRSAQKVLSILQAIREISATFHDIFGNNETTLEKANGRAEIVMARLKEIKDAKIFCDD